MTWEDAAARLRALRLETRMTCGEVARASGLSESAISEMERGRRRHRRSAIVAVIEGLVAVEPVLGDSRGIIEEVLQLAGEDIAPESEFAVTRARHETRWRARIQDPRSVRLRRDLRLATLANRAANRSGDLEAQLAAGEELARVGLELVGGDLPVTGVPESLGLQPLQEQRRTPHPEPDQ